MTEESYVVQAQDPSGTWIDFGRGDKDTALEFARKLSAGWNQFTGRFTETICSARVVAEYGAGDLEASYYNGVREDADQPERR